MVTIIFKPEVSQEDLGDSDPKVFLEKCSQFGIKVVDTQFSNLNVSYGLVCADCQLVDVEFYEAQIEGDNFSNSELKNVKFVNSNLKKSKFDNTKFSQVEFDNVQLESSSFDHCSVTPYSKKRIEDDGYLLFKNNCDLTKSSFINAKFCSKFEKVNLSSANFSDATLVACKFYDCTLIKTIFTRAIFSSFGTKENPSYLDLINCCITSKKTGEHNIFNGDDQDKIITIDECKFDNAVMRYVDLSNNITKNSDFQATDFYRASLYNCHFINTRFKSTISESASLKSSYISNSSFERKCNLTEVDFSEATMVGVKFNYSQLIRANFSSANLRGSEFISSELTGADFRYADLTLLNIDKCDLNSANFFQTKRGGINLNITKNKNGSLGTNQGQEEVNLDSSCTFDCIEWSPNIDGEIQIDKNSFLKIISGYTSPVAVISNLSKEGAQFIVNTYANAESSAKNADNDSSVNIRGDANDSSITTGNIEDKSNEDFEQDEDHNQEVN